MAQSTNGRQVIFHRVDRTDAPGGDEPKRVSYQQVTINLVERVDLKPASEFEEAALLRVQRLGGCLSPMTSLET
jgi:hypothetical protein